PIPRGQPVERSRHHWTRRSLRGAAPLNNSGGPREAGMTASPSTQAAQRPPRPTLTRSTCGLGEASRERRWKRSWVKPDESQAGILDVPAGDIHRLDAVAQRAFDEVIDRAQGDDTIATRVEGEAHVGEVRSGKE